MCESQPAVLQAEEKRARNPVPKCPSKLLEPAIGRSAGWSSLQGHFGTELRARFFCSLEYCSAVPTTYCMVWAVGTFQTRMVESYDAVMAVSSLGWYTTLLTFFEWPFKIATTCSSSLLNTAAVLSAPPVKIRLELLALMSKAKIPDWIIKSLLW